MCRQIKKTRGQKAFSALRAPKFLLPGKAFTLMELMIVLVIIGILVTLSMTQYLPLRERAFDREVEANLRLIAAGERIWRMEDANNLYRACATTALVNTDLRLSLPINNPNWNYQVFTYAGNTDFCVQAARVPVAPVPVRWWRICAPNVGARGPDPQPQNAACGPCP
jgi:prepilin-type N-terminal cleavage/methylation domain-containing protein